MKITRRSLLGIGAVAAIGGAGGLTFAQGRNLFRHQVHKTVLRYCPDIVFDGDDLTELSDYLQSTFFKGKKLGMLRLYYTLTATVLYHSPFHGMIKGTPLENKLMDRNVMHHFLLSSDYFTDPHTPGRRVKFVRPLDPYEAGCSNPLATLS